MHADDGIKTDDFSASQSCAGIPEDIPRYYMRCLARKAVKDVRRNQDSFAGLQRQRFSVQRHIQNAGFYQNYLDVIMQML